MNDAGSYRKVACPWCRGRIEFATADLGAVAPCPHCAQEIVLELPPPPPLSRSLTPPMPALEFQPARKSRAWQWWLLAGLVALGVWLGAPERARADALAGLVVLALYFLPALVANRRRHRQQAAILVVNLFLGWTLIGWVVALAWAVMEERK